MPRIDDFSQTGRERRWSCRLGSALLTLAALQFTALPIQAEEAAQATEAARPAVELVPITAKYSASYKKGVPIKGSAVRSLERLEDGVWDYRFNVESWVVDITERTKLRWENNQVVPLRYEYERSGWVAGRERSYEFDYEADKVHVNRDGDKLDAPLTKDLLDKLGYQLQLRMDLASGLSEMSYDVAHRSGSRKMEFAVIGEETITANGSQVPSVIVERVRDEDDGRMTKLWFAKNLNYVLVKMEQKEPDGEEYEILLEEAVVDGKKISLDL
ncbi:hypothetical protein GCM10022278_17070 [Allohahella marinimesophila]|uniref:DUF3108 domain-containing protein n=2 Tax=Allohahella marinimesophila TaxID=1054972 RepID=A0ABP7P6G7_9GAMM